MYIKINARQCCCTKCYYYPLSLSLSRLIRPFVTKCTGYTYTARYKLSAPHSTQLGFIDTSANRYKYLRRCDCHADLRGGSTSPQFFLSQIRTNQRPSPSILRPLNLSIQKNYRVAYCRLVMQKKCKA